MELCFNLWGSEMCYERTISIVQDLTSALTSTTRREYIPVGSSSASMLPTVVEASTEIMSSSFE
jgi:hypothetical protein